MSKVIGGWAAQYIINYLAQSHQHKSDKILLKVDNMSYEDMLHILQAVTNQESKIAQYYKPIIKTTGSVEGYEEYMCASNETAVWLRNSITTEEVVILFMTENIEANQSLKEVVAVDEISLLSELGLNSLYDYLKNETHLTPPEINEIEQFITVYKKIVDTQLTLYVSFIESILAGDSTTVIQTRISDALPKLRLFKMPSLDNSNKAHLEKQLRENYNFSKLRKNASSRFKEEDIWKNAERFIEEEDKNGKQYLGVWKVCANEADLLRKIQDFIEYRNQDLLELAYEDIKHIFQAKTSNTLKSRINNARQMLKDDLDMKLEEAADKNQQKHENLQAEIEFEEGLDAIKNKSDIEEMESFVDTFKDYLDPIDVRRVERDITRLKNPSNYMSFIEALMKEITFLLVEVQDTAAVSFEVSAPKESLTAEDIELVNFHTNLITQLSPKIRIEEADKSKRSGSSMPPYLTYTIQAKDSATNKVIETSEFMIDTHQLANSKTSFSIFYSILQEGSSKYIYKEDERTTEESIDEALEELSRVGEQNDSTLYELAEDLRTYLVQYEHFLKQILNKQLTFEHYNDFVLKTENLLQQTNETKVTTVQNVFEWFNKINVIDLKTKDMRLNISKLDEKIVSVFHPLALLGQLTRIVRMSNYIDFISHPEERVKLDNIVDIDNYVEYEYSRVVVAMPKYMVEGKGSKQLLIEREQQYGQSTMTTLSKQYSNSANVEHFAKEVNSVVLDYLKVYPYAADSLNLLLVNVTKVEFIKRMIKAVLKSDKIKRLNLAIYAEQDIIPFYRELSELIKEDERYAYLAGSELPRLTITVLPNSVHSSVIERIEEALKDYDLAIFMDYFTQSENENYNFEAIPVTIGSLEDRGWYEPEIQNYISKNGGTRFIDYTSHTLPAVLAAYYHIQYVLHEGTMHVKEDLTYPLLKGRLDIGGTEKHTIFAQVHDRFNWVMSYDRYLDADLVKQIDKKVTIVKYKLNHAIRDQHNVVISSSDTIKRGLENQDDYYYYDRISGRVADLLQIEPLSKDTTRAIINCVKELSGSLVLKSMGAGKFMHELLSVYFTLTYEQPVESQVEIWGTCDEITWFKGRGKRPDLMKTSISYDEEANVYRINLALIELKFIGDASYESEIKDAEKQLLAGQQSLEKYFDFPVEALDKDIRLDTFYRYVREARSYDELELIILEKLYKGTDSTIHFSYTKTIHAYIHSKAVDFVNKDQLELGHYYECSQDEIAIHTFTRPYILQQLNAKNGKEEVQIEMTKQGPEDHMLAVLGEQEVVEVIGEESPAVPAISEDTNVKLDIQPASEIIQPAVVTATPLENEAQPKAVAERQEALNVEENIVYTEQLALAGIAAVEQELDMTEVEKIATYYKSVLENRFRQNNIQLTVKEQLIGATVIRFICSIPPTQKYSAVESKVEDMQLWLEIDKEPTLTKNRYGINIDVVRDKPDTILFSRFMQLVRQQISQEKLQETLIVPIGLDPLNQVMYADFNKAPHLLVAGTTGSGKSVSVNSLVLSLMCLYTPEQLQFYFIDPKQVEFSRYSGTRHTMNVITDSNETVKFLEGLLTTMKERYELFKKVIVANINEYNEYLAESKTNEAPLSRLVIVFDEYAEFMLSNKDVAKQIDAAIKSLSGMGRAAGIHLIICTQTPKAEIIDTTIRNNLSVRLCLKVADKNASNVVLGEAGGEKLNGNGDYLLQIDQNLERGRSPYVEPKMMRGLIQYLSKE